MLLPTFLAFFAWLLQPSYSIPTLRHLFGSSIDSLDNVILFDAPAFRDHSGEWTAAIPAFVSLREISVQPMAKAFTLVLNDLGINVGNRAHTLADRLELFAAIGLSGKKLDVSVNGCNRGSFSLSRTSGLPNLGQSLTTVPLGNCNVTQLVANVRLSTSDTRGFSASIYPSPPDGFGVISGSFSFFLVGPMVNFFLG